MSGARWSRKLAAIHVMPQDDEAQVVSRMPAAEIWARDPTRGRVEQQCATSPHSRDDGVVMIIVAGRTSRAGAGCLSVIRPPAEEARHERLRTVTGLQRFTERCAVPESSSALRQPILSFDQ